ncbi:hypothetical protein RPB_0898 [Rhodopseudomonas palustris HaA2]|uniref:Uncharacterized protein n=1 Tax=Rhodopseudomonas palustris (strain HaA2) TaxID=316058 RepID=Q2J1Q1_RHOP2|nr:hypothetical protein [Rhodopseudomonas palustris]ABD05609.1 hypothetical protein RPB_0898 [Rhodopseudomonas palustris HaA2]
MLDYPCLTRRAIAATGFVATLAVLQVSATHGAVASNETITAPVSLGVIAQGVATSTTEAVVATSGAMAKAPVAATKRMRVATAARTLRRTEASSAPAGSWWQRRHIVLMLGIGY